MASCMGDEMRLDQTRWHFPALQAVAAFDLMYVCNVWCIKDCWGMCPTTCKIGQNICIYKKESIDLINSPGRLLGNKCILQIAGHKLNKESVIGCWYINMKTWFKSPAAIPQSHKCNIYLCSVEHICKSNTFQARFGLYRPKRNHRSVFYTFKKSNSPDGPSM